MSQHTPTQAAASVPDSEQTSTAAILRVGFAGTPEFAAVQLAALLRAPSVIEVVVVYTQPDRRAGRGRKLQASAVKRLAQEHDLPIAQPRSLRRGNAAAQLSAYNLDVLVVAAYGLILPQAILDVPRLGCLNVHGSLLPRWRGAAPVERAIQAGDTESGVCIMGMEAGLDTGPVFASAATAITAETTGRELHDAIAAAGAELLLDVLRDFDPQDCTPQDDSAATYAHKLSAEDALIDWQQAAAEVARHINALNDRLPARTAIGDEVLHLWRARVAPENPNDGATTEPALPGTIIKGPRKTLRIQCGSGAIEVLELQLRRGKARVMQTAAALNGYAELLQPGTRLAGVEPPDPMAATDG